MDDRAFSRDGFIICQEYLKDFQYGAYHTSVNGCGWVAAYNVMRFLGKETDFVKVYKDFLSILPYNGRMGTPMRTMLEYFRQKGVPCVTALGKKSVTAESARAECGILRYREGLEEHYVAFLSAGENAFRFLNVTEENMDFVSPLDKFLSTKTNFYRPRAIIIY